MPQGSVLLRTAVLEDWDGGPFFGVAMDEISRLFGRSHRAVYFRC